MSGARCPGPTAIVLSRDAVIARYGLDPSVAARLDRYAAELARWQKALNLVSPSDVDQVWGRHFADSLQLARCIPRSARSLADLGSGAGFPGLVLATACPLDVHLVESDHRKAAFLRHVSRETGTDVVVHACRIEDLVLDAVDIVTARALAPLSQLIEYASKFVHPRSIGLFPKGRRHAQELTALEGSQRVTIDLLASETADDSVIVRVRGW
jgi:16S rRNA (guanine527-N7)-methyltransferase